MILIQIEHARFGLRLEGYYNELGGCWYVFRCQFTTTTTVVPPHVDNRPPPSADPTDITTTTTTSACYSTTPTTLPELKLTSPNAAAVPFRDCKNDRHLNIFPFTNITIQVF